MLHPFRAPRMKYNSRSAPQELPRADNPGRAFVVHTTFISSREDTSTMAHFKSGTTTREKMCQPETHETDRNARLMHAGVTSEVTEYGTHRRKQRRRVWDLPYLNSIHLSDQLYINLNIVKVGGLILECLQFSLPFVPRGFHKQSNDISFDTNPIHTVSWRHRILPLI